MSWEEYKKKKNEESSWEQYKQKRQENIEKKIVTTKSSTNNKSSLWDNIQNIASGTGKVGNNLWQGLKNGVMSLQQKNFNYLTCSVNFCKLQFTLGHVSSCKIVGDWIRLFSKFPSGASLVVQW